MKMSRIELEKKEKVSTLNKLHASEIDKLKKSCEIKNEEMIRLVNKDTTFPSFTASRASNLTSFVYNDRGSECTRCEYREE